MLANKNGVRKLPVVGARLARLCFLGSGKRSEVTIEIEDGRRVVVPLEFAMMDLRISGPMTVNTRDHGDTEVLFEIVPVPKKPITIAEAEVCLPEIDDDEWGDVLREYAETTTTELGWCTPLEVRLVAKGQ